MKKRLLLLLLAAIALLAIVVVALSTRKAPRRTYEMTDALALPEPRYDSSVSVEEALLDRRSIRAYKDEPLSLAEVSQLLWAAQGITNRRGYRTAPSAGALYPLEIYLVVGNVTGIAPGVYKYSPQDNALSQIGADDAREALAAASLGQTCVREGAIDLVFAAVFERTTGKYGYRGHQYVHMEAGHAAQNVCLQAVALGLGTVVVGAFDDDAVSAALKLPGEERPLYVMPVGRIG